MKLLANVLALAACTVLSGFGHAQTVTVGDSGFETPDVSLLGLGGLKTYAYNSSTPDYLTGSSGWYVSPGANLDGNNDGSVTIVNQGLLGLIAAPITNDSTGQYLALGGLTANILGTSLVVQPQAGISQSIATVVGQDYQVSYLAGGLGVGVVTSNTVQLHAGVDGVTVTNPGGGGALLTLGVGTFANQSFTFTATSTQSVLDFYLNSAFGANVVGVGIDNVSVTAVPEPSHSAIILIGCVIAFSFLRRQMHKANAMILPKAVKI